MPDRAFLVAAALLMAGGCFASRMSAADASELLAPARALRDAGNLADAARAVERLLAEWKAGERLEIRPAALHRELGNIYAAQERVRAAAGQFEKSLAADPAQRTLHYRAGILYRRLGEHPKAAGHLAQAVASGLRNAGVLFHLAAAQFASGRNTAALENARAVLAPRPLQPGLAFRVGRLLFQRLFYRDALEAFEAAFLQSPESYEIRFYTALTNFLLNRHEQAVQLLEPLADPGAEGTAEAWTLLASALAALDRFDQAEELFEKAIARYPASPHAYLNRAFVLLEQDRSASAEAWLDKMRLAGGARSPKVFYAVRRNSCAEAEREISFQRPLAAGAGEQRKARRFFELAEVLRRRRHHGTAVELLRVASRYEAGYESRGEGKRGVDRPGLLHALAMNCLHLDPESPTPPRLLERAVALDPERHESHYLLGRAYRRQRKPVEAAAAFRRAIALEPDAGSYYVELGRALAAQRSPGSGAIEEAAALWRKAVEIDAGAVAARYELGKARMRQGRLAEAAAQLRKAVEAEPEFYEPYYVLGQIYARQKRAADARENFELFEKKKAAAEARSTIGEGFASEP